MLYQSVTDVYLYEDAKFIGYSHIALPIVIAYMHTSLPLQNSLLYTTYCNTQHEGITDTLATVNNHTLFFYR